MPVDQKQHIRASVLMAVYNKPEVLDRTLRALSRQSDDDFEIIICDDGSGEAIKQLLDDSAALFPGRIRHVWQQDMGFRKCRILNKGLTQARSDYIIVLDPDCIPHKHFIAAHLADRRSGRYLAGRRVMLGEKLSRYILGGRIRPEQLSNPFKLAWYMLAFPGNRHLGKGVYLPRFIRNIKESGPSRLKGCNMSFWQSDIEAVNGFDESFESPGGGEDTDLERRFQAMGLKSKGIKNGAVCYHLYHKPLPKAPGLKDQLAQLSRTHPIKASRGLKELQN